MANVSTQQLVDTISERTGLPKTQAKQAVSAVLEAMSEQLAGGNRIQLSGFGTFDVRERSARQGMNPKTKEKMTIPASKAVGFRAGAQLKQRIAATDGE
jgi:DNA-binding protein HU-beta